MNADQVMSRALTVVDEDRPIEAVWQTMKRLKVRHLPIVSDGKVTGIVSDRQLLARARRGIDGELSFPDLCAAEVMSHHPVCCGPQTPVGALARVMLDRRIDAVPIVTPHDGLLGLVTATDLIREICAEPPR